MAHVGAVQAAGSVVLHEQQVAGAIAGRAGPLFERRDHHEIRWPALPLDRVLRQVRRNPVGTVGALGCGIGGDAEPQLAVVPGAGNVIGFRRLEPAVLRPLPQRRHRRRDLGRFDLHELLQGCHPTLPPVVELRRRKPVQADQHVDRADESPFREQRLGRSRDALFQVLPCHRRAKPTRRVCSTKRWPPADRTISFPKALVAQGLSIPPRETPGRPATRTVQSATRPPRTLRDRGARHVDRSADQLADHRGGIGRMDPMK